MQAASLNVFINTKLMADRERAAALDAKTDVYKRQEQASALMAQAKSCHDELETYYRAAVDFGKVDEAAAECMEMFGLK